MAQPDPVDVEWRDEIDTLLWQYMGQHGNPDVLIAEERTAQDGDIGVEAWIVVNALKKFDKINGGGYEVDRRRACTGERRRKED